MVSAMETSPSTSAAPAAAAAAPAAAAPSSTPTTSSASTATTTAVDTTTSAAAASTPAAAAATTTPEMAPKDGESDAQYLARFLGAQGGIDEVEGVTPDAKPAEAAAADEHKTDEQKEAEKAAAEQPKTDAAADTDQDEDFDPLEETPVSLAPKELAEKIRTDAALSAALDANPELKNTLFAQSRLAAETAAFKEVFASAEEAKIAQQGNAEFSAISDLVTSIDKPEDAQGFYAKLLELSVMHDDDGAPIMKDGKPVSDGTVGRLIHHTGALFLNHFEQLAESTSDPELTAAVEILKARAFGGPASTNEDLTSEQQARQTELEARETALRTKEQEAQNKARADYEQAIVSGIDTHADSEVTKVLGRTDLPDASRAELATKIRDAAYNLIVKNPQFKREQDILERRPMGPKTREARIGLGKKWFATALPLVAPKLIAEAGAKVISKQTQRSQSQAARVDASRSDVAASMRSSAKPTQANPAELSANAESALRTRLGRAPETHELIRELLGKG